MQLLYSKFSRSYISSVFSYRYFKSVLRAEVILIDFVKLTLYMTAFFGTVSVTGSPLSFLQQIHVVL